MAEAGLPASLQTGKASVQLLLLSWYGLGKSALVGILNFVGGFYCNHFEK